jgi:uncharacterized RDD family membrane protein YckC
MPQPLQFETPENVLVQYEVAGLGTRFVAWFVDQILVWVLTFAVIIALLVLGVSFAIFDEAISEDADESQITLYFIGIMMLVWGLGSFVYFAASELLLGGQTVGKRACKIRVVKANGFRLDAPSVVLRNLFRVVDHLPPLWLVPLLTARSQRPGDLVAGTLVVSDARTELSPVRTTLANRAEAAQFQFDRAKLKALPASDFATIEKLLHRYSDLKPQEQTQLVQLCSTRLAQKLNIEAPAADQQLQFLEDLLAAEFRRRDRGLA